MTSAIPAELQDALAGSLSIEREIGRGGMGVVYLARDVMLDRPLALKVLHPHLAADPEQRARFLREARTGARLSHPHIVPIYDVGEAAGHVWFTMAFVDGESLATVLTRRGTLPAATVERLLREVGWALANAHRRDVLHRDVSLDNILIER
ncbi:MAG: serine/threonine protein kinase, partial [Gemmatimonadetes bacterium]|nr:serine/threonine protein kinase [Gemmatimonadota bacterium]